MPKPRYTGFERVIRATGFSLRGLRSAWRHEVAFRQECVLAVLLVPCAFLLGETLVQTALLLGVCLIVLIVELLNSALEAAVDRMGDAVDDLAGRAKDMGSAAVALAIVLVWMTWGLVALQRFRGLF